MVFSTGNQFPYKVLTPDELVGNINDQVPNEESTLTPAILTPRDSPFFPFPTFTQYTISHHFLNSASGQRSAQDFDRLMGVISDPRFVSSDLRNFQAVKMQRLLDSIDDHLGVSTLTGHDGWKHNVEVTI